MPSPNHPRCILAGIVFVAALTSSLPARADVLEVSPIKDNTLIETPMFNSNGAGDGIFVGRVNTFGDFTRRRGVIAFDLSTIPSDATVDAVTFTLQMVQTPDGAAHDVSLHRLTADWGEGGSIGGGIGAAAQPGEATWLQRNFGSTDWVSAGGDFEVAASATQVVADVGSYAWSGAGLVADVQAWVNSPASNFGWAIVGDESIQGTAKKFHSRQGTTLPRLRVEYTPANVGTPPGPMADRVFFAPPSPSPAQGPVRLAFVLPRAARVTLTIHDAAGRRCRSLVREATAAPGRHELVWDGHGEAGESIAPGLYLATLAVDGERHTQRIARLR